MPIGMKIFIAIFGIVWLCVFLFIIVNAYKVFTQNIEKAKKEKERLEKTNAVESKGKVDYENAQTQNRKKFVVCPYCKTKNGADECECKNCGANL